MARLSDDKVLIIMAHWWVNYLLGPFRSLFRGVVNPVLTQGARTSGFIWAVRVLGWHGAGTQNVLLSCPVLVGRDGTKREPGDTRRRLWRGLSEPAVRHQQIDLACGLPLSSCSWSERDMYVFTKGRLQPIASTTDKGYFWIFKILVLYQTPQKNKP